MGANTTARQPRPMAATNQPAPGSQQAVRPTSMNARPIIGQSTAQARPGMAMPQSTMPGRPQQGAPTMPQGARPGFNQYPAGSRPQVRLDCRFRHQIGGVHYILV
ncbi:hypothetical protein DPMN_183029 [Dreissena polymorpha]|uniref:Uncharacterized protein n=1 Tax=Dreissena polymorpha TaxID=45954 RepID=A0A9D4I604_DREPO|nr:hypothetical protein DPMN_183029 [Dreissena polymorpha]